MESVLTFINGRAYKKPELQDRGKYPVLRVGNLFTNSSWYYSDMELEPEKYCHQGDLLYAWSASFGPTIWDGPTCIFHYHIWNVLHDERLNRNYLYWHLLEDVSRVKSATTGSTMIHVSMEHMMPRLMAIPPAKEQVRIVSTLESLTPHIEQYGALEGEREKLDAELPDRLRKSILQMAVQGKLVPQDPNDEPASVLLERIRRERAELIKQKKLKAPKGGESVIYCGSDGGYYEKRGSSEPVCIDDEIPFEVPESWEWCRLGSYVANRVQIKPEVEFCYIDIASVDNVNNRLSSDETVIAAKDAPSRARKIVEKDDVIYSTVRPYLHNACIIDRDFSRMPIASTGFAVLVSLDKSCCKYLLSYLLSPTFDEYANANENAKGVAYPAINDERLYKVLIAVPPHEEQKRIVKAINSALLNL